MLSLIDNESSRFGSLLNVVHGFLQVSLIYLDALLRKTWEVRTTIFRHFNVLLLLLIAWDCSCITQRRPRHLLTLRSPKTTHRPRSINMGGNIEGGLLTVFKSFLTLC